MRHVNIILAIVYAQADNCYTSPLPFVLSIL